MLLALPRPLAGLANKSKDKSVCLNTIICLVMVRSIGASVVERAYRHNHHTTYTIYPPAFTNTSRRRFCLIIISTSLVPLPPPLRFSTHSPFHHHQARHGLQYPQGLTQQSCRLPDKKGLDMVLTMFSSRPEAGPDLQRAG